MTLAMHQVPAALGMLDREQIQGGLIAAVSSGRLVRGSNTYRNLTAAAGLLVEADSMLYDESRRDLARIKVAEAVRLFRREEEICLGSKRFSDEGEMAPYCTSFGMETFATLFRKEVLRISSVIGFAPPAAGKKVFAVDWGGDSTPGWLPYALGGAAVVGFFMIMGGAFKAGRRRRA